MLSFTDAAPVTGVRKTRDGYLVADVRIARAGNVQVYGGSELGKPEMPVIRVYRPEDTVFDRSAMATFAYRPVTVSHPKSMVDAENWREHAVGMTGGEVARDGEFIRIPLVLMDAEAIRQVESGTREVSCGYACDIAWEPGTTPDGQEYDAKITRVVGNHLAIVPKGRAGRECRIGDDSRTEPEPQKSPNPPSQHEVRPMADALTVMVDGLTIPVTPQGLEAIQKLQRQVGDANNELAGAQQRLRDAEASHATAIQAKDGEIAGLKAAHESALQAKDGEIAGLKAAHESALQAKDGEIAALQAQVSDEALEARAAARAALVSQAKAFLGDSYDAKGKSDADVRKDVVLKYLGDKADPSKPAVFFDHAFEVVSAKAPKLQVETVDPLRAAIADGAGFGSAAGDRIPGWQKASNRAAEAWKHNSRVKGNA